MLFQEDFNGLVAVKIGDFLQKIFEIFRLEFFIFHTAVGRVFYFFSQIQHEERQRLIDDFNDFFRNIQNFIFAASHCPAQPFLVAFRMRGKQVDKIIQYIQEKMVAEGFRGLVQLEHDQTLHTVHQILRGFFNRSQEILENLLSLLQKGFLARVGLQILLFFHQVSFAHGWCIKHFPAFELKNHGGLGVV